MPRLIRGLTTLLIAAVAVTGCYAVQRLVSQGPITKRSRWAMMVQSLPDPQRPVVLAELEQETLEDSREGDDGLEFLPGILTNEQVTPATLSSVATSLATSRWAIHAPLFLQLGHFRC